MSLHDRIREARKNKGITQTELGDLIGVAKTTVTGYEKNREPTAALLGAIADALDVDVNFLLQDEVKKRKDTTPTPHEMEHLIKKYRSLDGPGQEAVDAILDCEHRRCDAERQRPAKVVELFPTRKYLQSATAGYGDFNDDASYEMIDLVKRPPVGTSFIVTVNGNSMEPTYHDGDQLFIRAQERVQLGDIGLFTQGPKLYIKESGPDGLISHNKEYSLITGTEDEPIRAQGKVLGVCTEDYLPSFAR